MGDFTVSEPVDTSRQDIARECLHLACGASRDGEAADKTIERAQAYFDWVMKTAQEPQAGTVGTGGSETGRKVVTNAIG